PHVQSLLGVVLLAQEPDLACLFLADDASEQAGAVATVEASDPWPGLSEPRVVRGDGEVADDVKDVAAADRITGHHGDHRLGQPSDLDLEVEHVEAARAFGVDVAVVSANPLVAAGAERFSASAGEDDHPDLRVVARR